MRLESTKICKIKGKDCKSKRESCTQSARPGVKYMKLSRRLGGLTGRLWETFATGILLLQY